MTSSCLAVYYLDFPVCYSNVIMCLILFAYQTHPGYELILIANRDEFYARPTQTLGYWSEASDIIAGRDLEAGGTWLGVNRQARLAAITNYRQTNPNQNLTSSRGHLSSDFLKNNPMAETYLTD